MTFTEAALEVLRSVGEPLHYKKITELAIERNLLSHVGKTPEVTMSSRLATMVKKDRGSAPIVKVKPGVFAIRAEDEITEEAAPKNAEVEEVAEATEAPAETTTESGENGSSAEAESIVETPEKQVLPGADVFPEEDDDDDPILAGLGEEEGDERPGRRRRRRRRGKGPESGAEEGAGSVSADSPSRDGGREAGRDGGREAGRDGGREAGRDGGRGRDAGRGRDGGRSRDGGRNRDGGGREGARGRDGGRGRGRGGEERAAQSQQPPVDLSREPGDGDLLGKGLADAAYEVLSKAEKAPATFARAAEMLVARGRLSGQGSALAPTIAAALRADVAASDRTGARARFLLREGRVFLTDWLVPGEMARAEETALRHADRQRGEARRALLSRINDLPVAGFAELLATWLNTEGVTSLRAVRRPGSGSGEFHFAGTRRRGPEEQRLAIVVLRGGRDIDRETIISVRGALHHYGNAASAWIVSTGRLSSGAREESQAPTPAAVALFDGQELAGAMERQGIGLRARTVVISEIDFELMEALGGDLNLPQPRSERDEGREPREEGSGRRRRRSRSERDAERQARRDERKPEEAETQDGEAGDSEEASAEQSEVSTASTTEGASEMAVTEVAGDGEEVASEEIVDDTASDVESPLEAEDLPAEEIEPEVEDEAPVLEEDDDETSQDSEEDTEADSEED